MNQKDVDIKSEFLFLGHPTAFWIALKEQIEKGNTTTEALINEIADLTRKVAFYESRIQQMYQIMEKNP